MTTPIKEIIPLSEVAKMLGVDRETARRWSIAKRIPTFQYDARGYWRAYREDIDQWIASRQNQHSTGQVESAN